MAYNPNDKEVTIPDLPKKGFTGSDMLIVTTSEGTSGTITAAQIVETVIDQIEEAAPGSFYNDTYEF